MLAATQMTFVLCRRASSPSFPPSNLRFLASRIKPNFSISLSLSFHSSLRLAILPSSTKPAFSSLIRRTTQGTRGMATLTIHAVGATPEANKRRLSDENQLVVIGQHRWIKALSFDNKGNESGSALATKLSGLVDGGLLTKAVAQLAAEGGKGQIPLYLNMAKMISIPDKVSRHNTPSNAHAIYKELRGTSTPSGVKSLTIVLFTAYEHAFASVAAVAKAFPVFSMKSTTSNKDNNSTTEEGDSSKKAGKLEEIHLEVVVMADDEGGKKQESSLSSGDLAFLQSLVNSIRDYARLVDTPANILHTEAFVAEAEAMVNALGVPIEKTIIKGEALKEQGFGGIYNVGKAAVHPPIFACFSYKGGKTGAPSKNIALVGKGIVYDTGGMQIKGKTTMPTMKLDMGGAGALLASFCALVRGGFKENLHLLLCVAENSISPVANKPDDIITLLSGKTVEINNTDAEGRLVLADGVYYARNRLAATTIIDMATLTGAAQYISGRVHAAVISNKEECERTCIEAGRHSGDLAHPMVYAPDLHFSDLKSSVADMRNANFGTKDGPPSSIAALFIHKQIDFTDAVDWLHIDFASVVLDGKDQATGYGPALVCSVLGEHVDAGVGVLKRKAD